MKKFITLFGRFLVDAGTLLIFIIIIVATGIIGTFLSAPVAAVVFVVLCIIFFRSKNDLYMLLDEVESLKSIDRNIADLQQSEQGTATEIRTPKYIMSSIASAIDDSKNWFKLLGLLVISIAVGYFCPKDEVKIIASVIVFVVLVSRFVLSEYAEYLHRERHDCLVQIAYNLEVLSGKRKNKSGRSVVMDNPDYDPSLGYQPPAEIVDTGSKSRPSQTSIKDNPDYDPSLGYHAPGEQTPPPPPPPVQKQAFPEKKTSLNEEIVDIGTSGKGDSEESVSKTSGFTKFVIFVLIIAVGIVLYKVYSFMPSIITKTNNNSSVQAQQVQQGQDKQMVATQKTTSKTYKVGDKITFGSYPFYEDGREKAIDWIILDIDADGNALVISDYALDNVKYHEANAEITWEKSAIRMWLNGTFVKNAFSANQRSKIIESRIDSDDTYYKMFLLSLEEAEKYFKDDESRRAYPTPYAKSKKSVNGSLWVNNSYESSERGGSCCWWLRSHGGNPNSAADVSTSGAVDSDGIPVFYDYYSIRPALKINLNNLNQSTQDSVSSVATRTDAETLDKSYEVGDKITFGSYPFYEDSSEKAIDWIILDIDADGNALMISDYALDNVSFKEQRGGVTWESSTIREWLNNDFINNAFTEEQRDKIIQSRIENNDNSKYGTSGGNDTYDKLFLLSVEESDGYNGTELWKAYPTPYAKSENSAKGKKLLVSNTFVNTERGGSCSWWLRSPGKYQYYTAFVNHGGIVIGPGDNAGMARAVRPALKINLKNL